MGGKIQGQNEVVRHIVVEKGFLSKEKLDELCKVLAEEELSRSLIDILLDHNLISQEQARIVATERDFINISQTSTTEVLKELQEQAKTVKFMPDGHVLPDDVKNALAVEDNDFGRYILIKILAEGGQSQVHLAWDKELSRKIILKFLSSVNERDLARFKIEAQTQAKLSHPNIAQIYDIAEFKSRHYIAMQYIDGKTIDDAELTVGQKLEVIRTAAIALHHAHCQRIVHRDIKPNNIMIDKENRVYLTDFGLAKSIKADKKISQSGIIVGTPTYMSPEQARGKELDERSDVYSLGITLYELVTKTRPFTAETPIDIVMQVLKDDPIPPRKANPGIDWELEAIILKAIEKEPVRRYETAMHFAVDIYRYLNGEPIMARPPTLAYKAIKKLKKHREIFVSILITILAAVVAIYLLIQEHKRLTSLGEQHKIEEQKQRQALTLYREAIPIIEEIEEKMLTKVSRVPLDKSVIEIQKEYIGRIDQAISKLQESIKLYGSNPDVYLALGRTYITKGRITYDWIDFDLAERNLSRAIELLPTNFVARLERGKVYIYQFLINKISPVVSGPYPVKVRLLSEDQLKILSQKARQDIQTAVGGSPRERDKKWLEAFIPLIEGNYEQATKGFDMAIDLEGWNGELYLAGGLTLYLLKQYKEASSSVDKAIELMPYSSKLAYLLHALICLDAGNSKGAEADADAILKIDKDEGIAYILKVLAKVARNPFAILTAPAVLKELTLIQPRNWLSYLLKATAFSELNKHHDAIENLSKALELAHDVKEIRLVLFESRAKAYFMLKDYENAFADTQQMINIEPFYVAAYLQRGRIYFERKKYEQALEDFTQVTHLVKENQGVESFLPLFRIWGLPLDIPQNFQYNFEARRYISIIKKEQK